MLLSSEAFMCGLLHDVGKLILDQYFPDDLQRVRDCMASKRCSELDAESEVLGMTHADIGARLMEQWNLQENLIVCIRHHHNPNESDPYLQMDAEIVCFADRLVHSFEAETLTDDDLYHASLSVDSIQKDTLTSLLEATRERALYLLT